jgi:hypothetical protein
VIVQEEQSTAWNVEQEASEKIQWRQAPKNIPQRARDDLLAPTT